MITQIQHVKICGNTAKAAFRGKVIALNFYIRKEKGQVLTTQKSLIIVHKIPVSSYKLNVKHD